MMTEVPIFMKLDAAQSPQEAAKQLKLHLQNAQIFNVNPSPAYYTDGLTLKAAAAFNLEAENAEELRSAAEKLLALQVGKFDFVSIKFCGQGAHCCFAVVHNSLQDTAGIFHGFFSEPDDSPCLCGIMERSEQLCYIIILLKPETIQKLGCAEESQFVADWKNGVNLVLSQLNCGTKDFLQIGYQPF